MTDQKVKTTKSFLPNTPLFNSRSQSCCSCSSEKYGIFLSKPLLSTDWIVKLSSSGMYGLLICYCDANLCAFPKNNFYSNTLFRQCRRCFQSEVGKWSGMENSSKSVAATTPLRTSLPPSLFCRTLTPNSNRNFKNLQRISQLFDI